MIKFNSSPEPTIGCCYIYKLNINTLEMITGLTVKLTKTGIKYLIKKLK